MIYYLVISTIFFGGVFFLLKYVYLVIREIYYLHKLPGPPGRNFLLGNFRHVITSPETAFSFTRGLSKQHYPIYKLWIFHFIGVCMISPEDFELVMSNMNHIKKSEIYNSLKPWLNTGLLTSTGQKWQKRRKILTPAFHFNILQQFISIFNEETEKLVSQFRNEVGKTATNVTPHLADFTLKTIAETSMGVKLDSDSDMERAYRSAIYDIGEIILLRILNSFILYPLLYFFHPLRYRERPLLKTLHNFSKHVIAKRQSELAHSQSTSKGAKRRRLAMLDLLLVEHQQGAIDDEGVREEVDTFIFEGHDTTAAAIGFALMLIANHKRIQEQLVQEMEDVLHDVGRKPTFADLQQLALMERVVKETLRLYPSVHFISRTLGEDLVSHSGHLLPKHTVAHLMIYDMHHHPGLYPDPERFDPDRFLPENALGRHPFAYVPFSAGPRNCIGQKFAMLEMKTVLCGILANFELLPVDTPATITLLSDLVLRVKGGIRVKFVERRRMPTNSNKHV